MAWTTYDDRARATGQVRNLIGQIRTVHAATVILRDAKALYQAGTDPVFNNVFNELINSPADRTELATMIDQLVALCVTDWEAAHREALGLP